MFLNAQVVLIPQLVELKNRQQKQVITLKKLNSSNIDDFMRWASDDAVSKYMMWNTYGSYSEAEKFFENVVENHPWFKAICYGENVIGSVTLNKGNGVHHCRAELGYVIAKKYWGKGIATEAVRLAINVGFGDLEIERIEAYVDPVNIGSQRVLEKNGFQREGLLKSYVVQKGVIKDRIIYSFLRPIG